MTVNPLAIVSQTPAAQDLRRRVESGGALSLTGVSAGAQPFLAAWLHTLFPARPLIVVTEGLKAQESFQQDLETWLGAGGAGPDADAATESKAARPLFFPAWEILPHESKLPHADVVSERLETLVALGRKSICPAAIVVATVTALMQLTFPTGLLAKRTRVLKRGDRQDPLDLVEWLEAQGHEPEAQVTQKGDIALRGGILDVYPLTSPWPVRLEFFGDELESLRYFDPITQISREEITQVTLPPGGEIGILKRLVEEAGEGFDSRPGPRPELATLLDHLPGDAIFLLSEPEALAEHAMTYGAQIPDDDSFHLEWFEFRARLQAGQITTIEARELTALDQAFAQESEPGDQASPTGDSESPAGLVPRSPPAGEETYSILHPHTVELAFPSLDAYRPLAERAVDPQVAETQRREFFAQVHRWLRQAYQVRVFCNNAGERQRFGEIWAEYGFSGEVKARRSGGEEAVAPAAVAMLEPGLFTQVGSLTRGFLSDEAKLVVVTDAEIFGRYKMQRPRRLKGPHAAATRSALDIDFTELEEGDLVVHLQHGIGRYAGLQVMPTGSGRKGPDGAQRAPATEEGQECIVIEYAPADPAQPPPKLYVPVTESHLVSKYIGAGKARPQLNTLGGTKWTKAKAHAEHAVRDLASELLSIQAARETQSGYSFGADTPWQREFESSFFYEETPDQIKAIDASKKDMESARPMDRLICGDVGFGKTEVAIRAAFKAVMGGKQVAVLVPTTVLAQQHYNNLRERMADYPIRVDLLSRFRSRREQAKVIEDLAAGAVDIVIGTHRLVQKDVTFKDLGLVVIDEEQRFGVMHKEKFKLLRKMVDVLTLSATPIPRTLYLALTGARDMSTLETPPQDRLPIQTIVTQYDERIIREAIQREVNRGGQVFFLHNRVTTIDAMALKLKALLPNARLVIGHGQMDPDDLERVMTQFVNGEADVLLSTTIIESGLDIPNANTIIIDRADRFGLSELYQLRGRVGRYKHQAYAYLLIPRHARMLTDARKRISAIKQYSTLGSGFKIAMRDLEIRGAGNLLGSQQSGHITAVGFDLYCQLLKQSVAVLKGEKVKRRIEVTARFDFLALSPEEETRLPEPAADRAPKRAKFKINIPRETAAFSDDDDDEPIAAKAAERPREIAPAYLPLNYVNEPKHRIEIYRKLAQISDKPALDALQKEVRDRFGKVPESVDLLWQVAELKLLAGERGITMIEIKEDRVMLTRNNDYIQVGGKFPRLSKKEPAARLKEIKRLLLVL